MEYVVTLKNEIVVEAKNKRVAARLAARHFKEVLNGEEPKDSRGNEVKEAHFYCSPMEYTGAIEGQGTNDASIRMRKE